MADSGCAGVEVETAALEARRGERGFSGCCVAAGVGASAAAAAAALMGFRLKVRIEGTRKERRAWARSGWKGEQVSLDASWRACF